MEWKREVNTNLGITIILVFAAIFTIIDFYVVCSHIDGYPFNDVSGNTINNSNNDNTVVEDKEVVDVEDNTGNSLVDTETCSMDGYCLLYDKDNIKIEYNFNVENHGYNPELIFNGKKVSLNGMLQNYEILNDNYLFVVYGGPSGDSHPASFAIFDFSGNMVTEVNKSSLNDSLEVLYVSKDYNTIVYHGSPFNSDVEYYCRGLISQGAQQEAYDNYYNRLYYVKETYTYSGDGRISELERVEKTVLDYMKENFGYDNCQDALDNVESWKGKDVYSLFR